MEAVDQAEECLRRKNAEGGKGILEKLLLCLDSALQTKYCASDDMLRIVRIIARWIYSFPEEVNESLVESLLNRVDRLVDESKRINELLGVTSVLISNIILRIKPLSPKQIIGLTRNSIQLIILKSFEPKTQNIERNFKVIRATQLSLSQFISLNIYEWNLVGSSLLLFLQNISSGCKNTVRLLKNYFVDKDKTCFNENLSLEDYFSDINVPYQKSRILKYPESIIRSIKCYVSVISCIFKYFSHERILLDCWSLFWPKSSIDDHFLIVCSMDVQTNLIKDIFSAFSSVFAVAKKSIIVPKIFSAKLDSRSALTKNSILFVRQIFVNILRQYNDDDDENFLQLLLSASSVVIDNVFWTFGFSLVSDLREFLFTILDHLNLLLSTREKSYVASLKWMTLQLLTLIARNLQDSKLEYQTVIELVSTKNEKSYFDGRSSIFELIVENLTLSLSSEYDDDFVRQCSFFLGAFVNVYPHGLFVLLNTIAVIINANPFFYSVLFESLLRNFHSSVVNSSFSFSDSDLNFLNSKYVLGLSCNPLSFLLVFKEDKTLTNVLLGISFIPSFFLIHVPIFELKRMLQFALENLDDSRISFSLKMATIRLIGSLGKALQLHPENLHHSSEICVFNTLKSVAISSSERVPSRIKAIWGISNMLEFSYKELYSQNEMLVVTVTDLLTLCESCSNEKILSTTFRALGNAFQWARPSRERFQIGSFFERVSSLLISPGSSSHLKWNACYAAGRALSNSELADWYEDQPEIRASLDSLFKSLLIAVNGSNNRVCTSALVALKSGRTRKSYGSAFVFVVEGAFEFYEKIRNIDPKFKQTVEERYFQLFSHLISLIFQNDCSRESIVCVEDDLVVTLLEKYKGYISQILAGLSACTTFEGKKKCMLYVGKFFSGWDGLQEKTKMLM